MSENEKYLYAIIKKPQEGKTYVCLENINQSPNCIHLIITMNTIKSNLQFYERARKKFKNNICVLNSKSTKKKDQDASEYKHSKDVSSIKKFINAGIDIVIMCAHYRRFEESILDLIDLLDDSKSFYKDIILHIDEAHAYVPSYRDKIVKMNNYNITERIYLYSATPFNIWVDSYDNDNELYKYIYIVDIEEQFGIMKSKYYYGIKDCHHIIGWKDKIELINDVIPQEFIETWGDEKQKSVEQNKWYCEKFVFSLGNEQKFISYIKYVLKEQCGKSIKNDEFSYNFIPGYCRKLTHYAVMEEILKIYDNGIVVIINGNGSNIFYKDSHGTIVTEVMLFHNESVKQIKHIIENYPNKPLFITGFHCVGMSVTFIDEDIGNFDNVIFGHEQYLNSPDILYQLCRFLFNYHIWKDKSKIKETKLFIYSNDVLQICLKYEKQIDVIEKNMKGSLRNKEEVIGNIPVKRSKIPKERIHNKLEQFSIVHNVKTFPVEDEDGDEILIKVKEYYKDFTRKELKGKSLPSKNEDGFYTCSTTNKNEVQFDPVKIKNWAKNCKWDSNFQLTKTQKKYCRVYVAYENEDESINNYVWIIRRMEIQDIPEVNEIWKEINQKNL